MPCGPATQNSGKHLLRTLKTALIDCSTGSRWHATLTEDNEPQAVGSTGGSSTPGGAAAAALKEARSTHQRQTHSKPHTALTEGNESQAVGGDGGGGAPRGGRRTDQLEQGDAGELAEGGPSQVCIVVMGPEGYGWVPGSAAAGFGGVGKWGPGDE